MLIANTPMDTDKIKIYGARVKVDSMAKVGGRVCVWWGRQPRFEWRLCRRPGCGHTGSMTAVLGTRAACLRPRASSLPRLHPQKVAEIEAAEKAKMREKCEKILAHGINCFINRQLIYNYPEEIFADAGACGPARGRRRGELRSCAWVRARAQRISHPSSHGLAGAALCARACCRERPKGQRLSLTRLLPLPILQQASCPSSTPISTASSASRSCWAARSRPPLTTPLRCAQRRAVRHKRARAAENDTGGSAHTCMRR